MLQAIPEKKRYTVPELRETCRDPNEMFHIAAYELLWRGKEALNCKVFNFKIETDNRGRETE